MQDFTPYLNTNISHQEIATIFMWAKEALLPALKEGCFFPRSVSEYSISQEDLPLEKVFSSILYPFATQSLGGFDIDQTHCTKEHVIQTLSEAYSSFDGLFFGVEAPREPHFAADVIRKQECIVYERKSFLHDKQLCSWNGDMKNSASIYLYEDRKKDTCLYIGHMRSGTLKSNISVHNRTGLLKILQGDLAPQINRVYRASKDIFFGDVNFDVTSPEHIQVLQDFSNDIPVQFVVPQVRVRKMRIANRPFANNQVGKGGKIQNAESMIAVFPKEMYLEALDSMGLFVIREGKIWDYSLNAKPRMLQNEPSFTTYFAFSEHILLDHKPIIVRAEGKGYQFHNFMEFDGNKGFSGTLYDPNRLIEAEVMFVEKLMSLLTGRENE